ncbi:hypothetical protein [Vulcanisaeta thermophila]|uniref:hypothetical protein n=1 Tax=Vulcanisaeta thermophila TaxID=867917 RepID=UPI0008539492|nr:hypothetical protein [Vulcanisaeta thermophila]
MLNPDVINLIRETVSSTIRTINLNLLTSLRRFTIRNGTWWRLNPLRRGLIEAAIAYLKTGRTIKSTALLAMIKDAVTELISMTLAKKIPFIARLIGLRLISRTGTKTNPLILGIQWLNTPPIYRTPLT